MKKIQILLIAFIASVHLMAQAPQAMNYQAVARDNSGNVLAGQSIGIRISILSGSITGTIVYSETHQVTTSPLGLFNLQVGAGTPVSGAMTSINWGAAAHFMKIEMDIAGGTNYQEIGTSQLVSVPYALYAANAANDFDKDSTNEIQTLQKNGHTLSLSKDLATVDLSPYMDDTDAQTLSLSTKGDTLKISKGNAIVLKDADKDSTNEIQGLQKTGHLVTITKNKFSPAIDLTAYAQTLSLKGDTLKISGGNSVVIPKVSASGNSSDILHVKDFGAKGDGTTNDRGAIQKALDSLKKRGGGELMFGAGLTYVVDSGVYIIATNKFKINGNGATVKMMNGVTVATGYHLFQFRNCNDFTIENLYTDGNRVGRTAAENNGHNVIIFGGRRFSFINCRFDNAVTDGMYISASATNDLTKIPRNGLLLNCHADNAFRNGISIINAWDMQILGGTYTNANGAPLGPWAGIDVEPNHGNSAEPNIRSVIIEGATFSNNNGYGIQTVDVGASQHVVIRGNYFSQNKLGGVLAALTQMVIEGNMFENFSSIVSPGRSIVDIPATASAKNITITANTFRNITPNVPLVYIHSSAGSGIRVTNNSFENCGGIGVVCYKGGVTISDNTFNTLSGVAVYLYASNCVINDNHITATTGSAIYMHTAAKNNIVTGNQCIDIVSPSTSNGIIRSSIATNIIRHNAVILNTPNMSVEGIKSQASDIVGDNIIVGCLP